MTFVKNVLLDLREKRLWPVALLLVLAILAVPLLVGAPDEGPPPATPVAGTGAEEAPASAQLAVARPGLPGARRRAGALRDPFFRALQAGRGDAVAGPAAATTTTTPGERSSGGSSVPGDSATEPLPDLTFPAPDPLPAPRGTSRPDGGDGPADVVSVRVGRAGALRVRGGVTARTPLPSAEDPFLVFLGTKPDGVSAQFLVSDEAVPTGDGRCRPHPGLCEEIVMKAGETEFFDLTGPDGEPVQYQMDVLRVG